MTDDLQRRYRRLLACYPPEHRIMYEDEMLGVLLAGARPQQRYPDLSEAYDLLVSAIWMRLGRTGAGIATQRWSDAAATFGVLAPMLLFAQQVRPNLDAYLWWARLSGGGMRLPAIAWVAIAAWAVVAVTARCRWRVAAATTAWVAVLGEAILLGHRYHTQPVDVLHALWPLALATTAAATLSVPGTTGRAATILGWRRYTIFTLGTIVVTLSAAVDPLTARITRSGNHMSISLWPGGGGHLPTLLNGGPMGGAGLVTVIVCTIAAGTMTLVIARTAPPIRRRFLALLAPATALLVVVRLFFAGYAVSSSRFSSPVLLTPLQWIVLAATPILAFLVAVTIVHHRERRLHLIKLGQAAERQLPAAASPASAGQTDHESTRQPPT